MLTTTASAPTPTWGEVTISEGLEYIPAEAFSVGKMIHVCVLYQVYVEGIVACTDVVVG